MAGDKSFISFPPGSVSDEPVRIPILANTDRYLALNKPAGLNGFQERRLGGGARDIAGDIRARAASGAGQFQRLGIAAAWPVHFPGCEESGVFLFAKTREAKSVLRNELGSGRFRFEYHFLAEEAPAEERVVCELPLASSPADAFGFVSHKNGKKAATEFERLKSVGGCSVWRAVSAFDRVHQVRVHAAETGFRIAGESVYRAGGRTAAAGNALPPSWLALHLYRLSFSIAGEKVELTAEYSSRFRERIRVLGWRSSRSGMPPDR